MQPIQAPRSKNAFALTKGSESLWLVLCATLGMVFTSVHPAVGTVPEATSSAKKSLHRLGFASYGPVRLGDTPQQVRRKVRLDRPCHRLRGLCHCDTVMLGYSPLGFAYRLDSGLGLDMISTSSPAVRGPRGIRVGDSVGKLKRLFPRVQRRSPVFNSTPRYIVRRTKRVGLRADVVRGKITSIDVGKARYFSMVEYCS